MTKSPSLLHRAALGAAVIGLPLALSLSSCELVTTTPTAAGVAGCPDVSSVGAVMKIDWAKEFGIDVKAAASIGAGVRAAVQVGVFAASLDAKLVSACGNMAKDLGKPGTFANGQEACKAAMSAMGEVKAKIGASAKITLAVQPPRCSASLDAMADCVAECDVNVEPGSVQVECEPGKLSGTCEAQCSGRCDLSAAAQCAGTCEGSCSASFSGTCGGECNGKCDGKAMSGGSCAGKCEGSCSALAEGSCGGQCSGSCQMSAAAKCEGTCTGACSVEMQAPSCEGKVEPPQASAECNAACEAEVTAELTCEPAKVALVVEGGADAQAVATLRTALENNLPAVLEIAIGMKDQALSVAGDVKVVVQGVQATIKSLDGAGTAGARLAACVAAPFKAAFDGAASIQANVSISVEVQASASASASGSAG